MSISQEVLKEFLAAIDKVSDMVDALEFPGDSSSTMTILASDRAYTFKMINEIHPQQSATLVGDQLLSNRIKIQIWSALLAIEEDDFGAARTCLYLARVILQEVIDELPS